TLRKLFMWAPLTASIWEPAANVSAIPSAIRTATIPICCDFNTTPAARRRGGVQSGVEVTLCGGLKKKMSACATMGLGARLVNVGGPDATDEAADYPYLPHNTYL